jgi:hypothetical protein
MGITALGAGLEEEEVSEADLGEDIVVVEALEEDIAEEEVALVADIAAAEDIQGDFSDTKASCHTFDEDMTVSGRQWFFRKMVNKEKL